jgi:hypothetical protein
MVNEKDRGTSGQSVYEFQSLSPENGFSFVSERNRKALEDSLRPEQIFKIHEAKFLIWERFGMVNVVLGKSFAYEDIALIAHSVAPGKDDYSFDIPNFLYMTFDSEKETMFANRWGADYGYTNPEGLYGRNLQERKTEECSGRGSNHNGTTKP